MTGEATPLNRRQPLRAVAIGGGGALVAPTPTTEVGPMARTCHQLLLRHTRWAEQHYDPAAGHYRRTDFGFAVVPGNAVPLTRGDHDPAAAADDNPRTTRTPGHATPRGLPIRQAQEEPR